MPNPLMTNAGKTPTQKVQGHDKVRPNTEHYAGVNNPYRGTQDHGVPVKDTSHQIPDFNDPELVEYEDEVTEHEPIPVRIVSESAREIRQWRQTQEYPRENPQRVVGEWDKRTSLKITNLGPDVVYISPDSNVSLMSGYPIPVGKEISMVTTDDVWAVAIGENDNTATLAILMEYTTKAY